ncbi:MAG: acyltransferase [Sphingomonas sp.]|nr:MAG: acyltransferase [Sphingomonas sp.]
MRIPALDGLRAVAILSVMSFHANLWFAPGGSLGVDIFFVLSGWLITGLLIDEVERTGAIDRRAFLARRMRRLLPALSCLLLAYLLVAPWLYPESADRRWFDAATAFLYLTNLRESFWPADTPLSHSWSLAVEAQFYLLWPFVVPALLRLGRRRAALLLCACWLCLTALRSVWPAMIGGASTYYLSPLHATGLLLGGALALRPIPVRRGPLALAPKSRPCSSSPIRRARWRCRRCDSSDAFRTASICGTFRCCGSCRREHLRRSSRSSPHRSLRAGCRMR